MKNFWMVLAVGLVALNMNAADKLPEYNSPQYHALPGMKDVRAAAEKGDAEAMYLLACDIVVRKGNAGLPIDMVDREWELKAFKQGISIYQHPLYGRDPQKALAKYRSFAENGFYLAQRIIAEIMMQNNEAGYLEWFRKAADQGDDISQYNLGLAYVTGKSGSPDPAMARKYWELSAAQGNAGAMKDLGILWIDGVNGKKDLAKGIKYLKLAAARGNTEAAFLLGEMYSEGRGVQVNMVLAADYFRKAAEKEPAVAMQISRNAEMHFNTAMELQQKNNIARSNGFLKRAAAYGHPQAPVLLIRSRFVSKNEKERSEAIKEMTALAQKGNALAQAHLALMLDAVGRKDEALTWYCRALGNGEMQAFITAPTLLFSKFNDIQKHYLKGVFLRAEFLDEADMQYISLYLGNQNIFPEKAKEAEKHFYALFYKKYPKIVYYVNNNELRGSTELTKEQKETIISTIKEQEKILRQLAKEGDCDAERLIKIFSKPKSQKKVMSQIL